MLFIFKGMTIAGLAIFGFRIFDSLVRIESSSASICLFVLNPKERRSKTSISHQLSINHTSNDVRDMRSSRASIGIRLAALALLIPAHSFTVRPLSTATFVTKDGRKTFHSRPTRRQSLSEKDAIVVASTTTAIHTATDNTPRKTKRRIDRVEKFSRLPVWPVWNGVFLFVISQVFGEELSAKLEDAFGGRVCPNFFAAEQTSPFVMLVHHRHSFAPWDPLRYIQRTFFPEGFPSHPHRGFVTVTYFLHGGFKHRDSQGVKQLYGAEERHKGKHTQWLTTGAGILHEEMFDIEPDKGGIDFLQPSSQELYQLWLNLPSKHKMSKPITKLLGGEEETPTVKTLNTETIVLAGEHGGKQSAAPNLSDVAILHVKMEPDSTWTHEFPASHKTVIMYVRKGAVTIDETRVAPQHTAYFVPFGEELIVTSSEGADFLLLAGEPMYEPIASQGSMVMNTPEEINAAYSDYQQQKMGVPWDHKISDEEWKEHVSQNPSIYK